MHRRKTLTGKELEAAAGVTPKELEEHLLAAATKFYAEKEFEPVPKRSAL